MYLYNKPCLGVYVCRRVDLFTRGTSAMVFLQGGLNSSGTQDIDLMACRVKKSFAAEV